MTCVSVLRVLCKRDEIRMRLPIKQILMPTQEFAAWLTGAGLGSAVETVSIERLIATERSVFLVLGSHLFLPSVKTWLSTLAIRFCTLSSGYFQLGLELVWGNLVARAGALLSLVPATEMAPQRMATGIVILGLVEAGLLPLKLTQPEGVTAEAWLQLFTNIQPQACAPTCSLPSERSEEMVKLLEMTLGCNCTDLLRDVHTVTLAILQDIQSVRSR